MLGVAGKKGGRGWLGKGSQEACRVNGEGYCCAAEDKGGRRGEVGVARVRDGARLKVAGGCCWVGVGQGRGVGAGRGASKTHGEKTEKDARCSRLSGVACCARGGWRTPVCASPASMRHALCGMRFPGWAHWQLPGWAACTETTVLVGLNGTSLRRATFALGARRPDKVFSPLCDKARPQAPRTS